MPSDSGQQPPKHLMAIFYIVILNLLSLIALLGLEVLTPVVVKSTISWDIAPCSPLKVNHHLLSPWHLGPLIPP
jgi:hypothetical protein